PAAVLDRGAGASHRQGVRWRTHTGGADGRRLAAAAARRAAGADRGGRRRAGRPPPGGAAGRPLPPAEAVRRLIRAADQTTWRRGGAAVAPPRRRIARPLRAVGRPGAGRPAAGARPRADVTGAAASGPPEIDDGENGRGVGGLPDRVHRRRLATGRDRAEASAR